MRELEIRSIWVSPYKRSTIDPDFSDCLKNILNRNFNPVLPNTVWVTNINHSLKKWVKHGMIRLNSHLFQICVVHTVQLKFPYQFVTDHPVCMPLQQYSSALKLNFSFHHALAQNQVLPVHSLL